MTQRTITLHLTPEEVTIIADSLSDSLDDLHVGHGSELLAMKTKALLTKIEGVEQTEVFPH